MTDPTPSTVIHVHDRSAWGGNIEHIRILCRGLDPARFRAVAAGPDDAGWTQRFRDAGIPTVPSQIDSKWDVRAALRLAGHLRSEQAAIVHTHIRRADLMGAVAARLAPPTVAIATLHGPVCVDEQGVERFGLSERVYAQVLQRGFARIITVSEAVRQEAIERLGCRPDQVVHVVNGTDLSRFGGAGDRAAAGLHADEIGIGMVSRFVAHGSHMKGHAELLRAFAGLAAAHPRAVLVLIGDGESRGAMKALAGELGVAGRVRFLGHRDDVPAILPALDIVALPSRGEGLPRCLVEAMASGVAVVGSTVGGIPELLRGDAGLLVPPGDVDALRESLAGLLADPARRQRLAEAGRERARLYDAAAMCRGVAGVYEDVLNDRPGA